MIMKHVILTVQGDRAVRQGEDRGEPQQHHRGKLQPARPRTDADVQQEQTDGMAIREEQRSSIS